MLALYRSGRQAEALDVYQDTRRALVDELGIDPSRELRELEHAILRQDATLTLVRTTDAAEAAGATRGVFVGRASELAELRAGLEDAIGGRGRLFLLVGEPGIGKSRLADEVIRQARERGALVLVGRCWEAGGAPAFWPWVQSIRAYVEQSEPEALRLQLGDGAADMAQIIPELHAIFPGLRGPALETEGARFRLFDSAARFFKSAAATGPIVLVLDDLHAADEPSLLLLRFVAGDLGSSRILVVGTYRDVDPTVRDPLAATLVELAREQVTHRIQLGGLTEEDVARFVELNTGATPPPEVISAIHTETEGNPLFVGEVVRLLAAESRLSDVDVSELWTLGIPQGVREVIGRRLRRLSEDCATVVTLASVLGREFRVDALERLTELPSDRLFDALDEAMAARLLMSVPGATGRLRFAHALIRETLYDGLTTLRRVQLHRRAGEALESLYRADPEPHLAELAYHFFEAAPGGDVDKALAYAERAGDRGLDLLAYEEAARLYELALQALHLKDGADAGHRCDLLLARGDALAKAGSTPEAKQTFLAAADLARTSELPERFARAALGYGGSFPWFRAGTDNRLVPLLEEALALSGERESILRVRLLARLAGALRDQPSLEPRSSLSREAVKIARRLGDADALGYALVSAATAAWGPETEEMAAIAEEVMQLAELTGDADLALQARWVDLLTSMTLGDSDRIATLIDEYEVVAEDLKQPVQQWYSAMQRCSWALFQGEFARAERLAEEALELGQRAQEWDARFSHCLALFVLRREQGRLEEIAGLIRDSVDDYAGYRSLRCLVALLECELGREEEARLAFEELATADFAQLPRDSEWLFCVSVLAEVAAYLRDCDRASTLRRLLLPYAHLNAVDAAEVAAGSVARYLGILASTTSEWDQAALHFEDALAMNKRMGARPWVARTQEDYARMLFERDAPGDQEKAEELLAVALAAYRQLGMEGPLAKATAVSAR